MTGSRGQIESTPLWKDIQNTLLSGPKITKFDMRGMLHTEVDDFVVMKILGMEDKSDYVDDITSTKHVRFYLGLGDYSYKLYPYRQNLEFSLKYIPLTERDADDLEEEVEVVRYKAFLDPLSNPQPTGTRIAIQDYDNLNQSQLVEVKLQLQYRPFEPLRTKAMSGVIFQGKTAKQLIYSCLKGESDKVTVDGKPACDGVNLVEPDNTVPIQNAFFKTGLSVALVPTFIQQKLQGVYNAGIGTFYQRFNKLNLWFVYPLFNPLLFDTDVDRAVLFAVPEDRFPEIDRSYRKEGKILYIAVTGDRSYYDSGHIVDLNEGVGFRMADANAMMKKPIEMTPDGPRAVRPRLNYEITGRQRQDGNYYAPTVSSSSNPFEQYSSLAGRQLARVNVAWENSDESLIYPGMPCKYVFMDQDDYQERRGIILGKYTSTTLDGAPGVSNSYHRSTHLSLMIEPFEERTSKPVQKTAGVF